MNVKLSLKQQEVVEHVDGAILVKAGPGSGKTRVLIERVKTILKSKKRVKILALTFSNLAADEMKSRIEEDENLGDLINNVSVGTIHSFCLDLVQSRSNLLGLSQELVLFENDSDREGILKDVFLSSPDLLPILQNNKDKNIIREYLSEISDSKKKFELPDDTNKEYPFSEIYSRYNEALIFQNAIDFDDILFLAYRILSENPKVKKMYNTLYKYIFVDEAQDLNLAQYQVLVALCGDEFENIMMVGDENQSIYGFNGSDSKLMSEAFVYDFKPTIYELNENYRSAKTIVNYANKLECCENITNYVIEGELNAIKFKDEAEEAEYILERILYLKEKGHKDIENIPDFEDFAIIGRNKYVFKEVENILKENNIAYFLKKSSSGIDIESEYIKSFGFAIRILLNSKDLVHIKKLCKIMKVKENIISNNENSLSKIRKIFENHSFETMINALDEISDFSKDLDFNKALKKLELTLENFEDEDKYLVQNDIEQWRMHWKQYCRKVPRENRSLISFQNSISLGKTQDTSSENGIALLTAHMSKGLQYEVVFVIGLNEGTFPDYRAIRSGDKEMEQEKNNMYVAVTRAKRLCYLTYPEIKLMPWGDYKRQTPSRFLSEII